MALCEDQNVDEEVVAILTVAKTTRRKDKNGRFFKYLCSKNIDRKKYGKFVFLEHHSHSFLNRKYRKTYFDSKMDIQPNSDSLPIGVGANIWAVEKRNPAMQWRYATGIRIISLRLSELV